ncbi:MAG: NUDIX domain-containing protein [Proteobacteria bacterium]|jgi:8-oxo-dGTP pyrophosphatase MutT (NUDIX family)|nr:NUDIX domain-containing protein [Pseudomonadota bacterium]NBP15258.1 NUDIX domain-containing protein [bacterium]
MTYYRVGVVVIKDDKVLLMHRVKNGKAYYSFLGGRPEAGETPEQTALRELKEETNLDGILGKCLGMVPEKEIGSLGLYYLCTEFSGNPELGGPEKEVSCPENQFSLAWVNKADLKTIIVYPQEVIELLEL